MRPLGLLAQYTKGSTPAYVARAYIPWLSRYVDVCNANSRPPDVELVSVLWQRHKWFQTPVRAEIYCSSGDLGSLLQVWLPQAVSSNDPILSPRMCLFNKTPWALLSTAWHSPVGELHLYNWHWAFLPGASWAGEITIAILFTDPVLCTLTSSKSQKTHMSCNTKDRQGCTVTLPSPQQQLTLGLIYSILTVYKTWRRKAVLLGD